jgi:Cerato-platanin
MRFSTLFAPFALALLGPSTTLADQVTYDTTYDNSGGSLTTVACSDGSNGLITRGFSTFGSLPSFPYIGGAAAIAGWNSASCGTCWALTYTNAQGAQTTINVLAIDVAKSGFNIALSAMNQLTNGNAVQYGIVNVTSTNVAPSVCGL